MTVRSVVELGSDRLHVVATPNGRVRYPVIVYAREAPSVPIGTADANLTSPDDRAKLIDQLPEAFRAEAGPLLMGMAAQVTRRSLEVPAKERGTSGDPPLEPWPEALNGAVVLECVRACLTRYVVLPPHAPEALALWIAHTYATDVTDYTPYILVTSPVRECGKSVLLEVLRWLAFRAQMTGGITAGALYRRIDRDGPTMLLDELDTRLRGDSGEALRGVLNTGFHRSGKVTICVGDDHEERDFSTYCPKVLAGIGRVWDTVTSRSIPIPMSRAAKDELRLLTKIRGDRIGEALREERQKLLRWVSDSRDSLREADPEVPADLGARQSDVWRPLLAIADLAGGEWPSRAREAAQVLHGIAEDEGDYGLLMLEDVHALIGSADAIFTATILDELIKREDRPWPEYRHDKPITARGVASLLGRFGVKPGTVRVGSATGKGYAREKLAPAFNRYLKPPIPLNANVTSVTTGDGQASNEAPAAQAGGV